ncbi:MULTISPECIES: aminopeptidase P family protein [Vibrio]|uniref:aminopeptidase P family protein n=1 Tax=Vibrio TaxID=662 RepID=UPI00207585EE|nr:MULTISPECIES: aminopeptidase P family protein [Vibrio]USD34575.1 aminopeptidase P family protein [Vibrio sp. SCSIO 43186]USD47643.1 aminopeptidase P family protein [Vibrio sp. SCSIO 43145]USD71700.1 aminopeptidase P family protein [Vibrio sp. SCSIO 43139]USD98604.1 Xaa-Pro aminopeptidase [Vibrio coralliilyticus]
MTLATVAQRLNALREEMAEHQFDAYIVTNNDPHSSEYSADYWLAREWISGFTGSAGNAVITTKSGGLWTDGRYYIQATEQLQGSGLTLFKARLPETPTIAQYLADSLEQNSRVGVDGRSISQQFYLELKAAFKAKSIQLVLDQDLISPIWADRPARPNAPLFNHPLEFAGQTASEKITRIRRVLKQKAADALLVSTLDDVMWALNIRGGDTLYCPISESYLLITLNRCQLFVDKQKLTSDVIATLTEHGIEMEDYTQLSKTLKAFTPDSVLIHDRRNTDSLLISHIPSQVRLLNMACPVTAMKARKNHTELASMEETLRKDGAAVVRFMKWLDEQVPSGKVTELNAEQTLMGYRKEINGYIGESFRTIAGFAEHGAKMHYAADDKSNYRVDESQFFLVDSGGQYLGGTTDITRTFHFGQPSEQQRRDYTLVLKAVIRLTQTRFMKGSTGANLDIMARGVLWQHGIDYKCGTGHGVGICLNVHEGPQNFSQNPAEVALEPGMVITNEPGVYRQGQYGIRIENILKVVELEENEFGTFYGFETITLAPIATNMLDKSLLLKDEVHWLNTYHQQCLEQLSPYLDSDTQNWLNSATKPI